MSELPAHLSYSSASSYEECPFRWKAERLHGLEQDPSVWLIGGSAFHKATELFDHQFEQGAFATDTVYQAFDDAVEKYRGEARQVEPDETKWRAAAKGKETLSWWINFGRQLLDKYIAFRTTSPYDLYRLPDGSPAIEVAVPHIVGGVYVKGFVDRVMVDTRTGEVIIVDLKSGARMPSNDKQLGGYKVGLEANFAPQTGPVFNDGAFYNARKGQLTGHIPLFTYDADSVGQWYSGIRREIEAGHFPPRLNTFCKSCPARLYCPAFSGAAAQALPPAA